jgi:hypothetical protein
MMNNGEFIIKNRDLIMNNGIRVRLKMKRSGKKS